MSFDLRRAVRGKKQLRKDIRGDVAGPGVNRGFVDCVIRAFDAEIDDGGSESCVLV